MKLLSSKFDLQLYQNYLFVFLAFILPISTAGVSLSIALITILWLIEGDFSRKFGEIKVNYVALSILAFLALHLVGLTWLDVEPINAHKVYLLLLVPMVMTSIRKEFIQFILGGFVLAMTISEAISYYKIFTNWDALSVTIDPRTLSPFLSTITYNPFLAFSIGLLIVSIIQKQIDIKYKFIFIFFIITMTMNIFLTGGRAGQVVLFVIFMLLTLFYLYKNKKLLIIALVAIPLLYFSLYQFSNTFKIRVDGAINNIVNYSNTSAEDNHKTDVGARLLWTMTSWELVKEKPFFGHGSGSFEKEYARKNHEISPNIEPTSNPHNNYILVMVQFGMFGLIFFLAIFATEIRAFIHSPNDELKPIRLILPVMFMVICLSDTYLWGHHTQAMFALFSGILYSDRVL